MIYLKVGVAVVVLLILAFTQDWSQALALLSSLEWSWVIAAVLLNVSAVLFSAWRWRRLVHVLDVPLKWGQAVSLYWIGSFFSTVMPSNVGGDAIRVAMARRIGGVAQVLASIVVERVTGLAALLTLCVLPALWWTARLVSVPSAVIVAVLGLGCLAVLARFRESIVARAVSQLPRRLATVAARRLGGVLEKLSNAFAGYRANVRALWESYGYAFLFYGLSFCTQAMTLLAVGGSVDGVQVLLAAPFVLLVSVLPISFNGIGVAEGAFVFAYSGVGVAPEVALAAALLRRLLITAVAAFGAFFWLRARREHGTVERAGE